LSIVCKVSKIKSHGWPLDTYCRKDIHISSLFQMDALTSYIFEKVGRGNLHDIPISQIKKELGLN
jgi:hypothetical protein